MTLWDWAIKAYALPGVAHACLDLQDRHGQSVPYLLWAAWAAQQGRTPPDEALSAGADLSRTWDEIAVDPLRRVRRQLTAPIDGISAQALREQVKAAELAAEHALMQALQAMTPGARGSPRPLAPALVQAAQAWGAPVPLDPLNDLAAKLG